MRVALILLLAFLMQLPVHAEIMWNDSPALMLIDVQSTPSVVANDANETFMRNKLIEALVILRQYDDALENNWKRRQAMLLMFPAYHPSKSEDSETSKLSKRRNKCATTVKSLLTCLNDYRAARLANQKALQEILQD
jgi:hypothetical protein